MAWGGCLVNGDETKIVAGAIANHPELLLADEPTSELDLSNTIVVFMLLRDLAHSQGMTVAVATHDSLVKELGYDIQEMVDGTFVDYAKHSLAESFKDE